MAWYHQVGAKILSKVPGLYEKLTMFFAGELPADVPESPWVPVDFDPFRARLMMITTGGGHAPEQPPFDMDDTRGDASYRWIERDQSEFEITHDYYDHSDADDDINCLYPLPLAKQLSGKNKIGPLVERHLSFMGHIEDPLVPELLHDTLPAMWDELSDRPDLVLLSPG